MRVSLWKPNRLVEDLDPAVLIDSPNTSDLAATELQGVFKTDRPGQMAQMGCEQSRLSLVGQPLSDIRTDGLFL